MPRAPGGCHGWRVLVKMSCGRRQRGAKGVDAEGGHTTGGRGRTHRPQDAHLRHLEDVLDGRLAGILGPRLEQRGALVRLHGGGSFLRKRRASEAESARHPVRSRPSPCVVGVSRASLGWTSRIGVRSWQAVLGYRSTSSDNEQRQRQRYGTLSGGRSVRRLGFSDVASSGFDVAAPSPDAAQTRPELPRLG